MQLYQWEEAVNGYWVDKGNAPTDSDSETMLITYQTGKGSDHLVPVLVPPETLPAMQYLTNMEVQQNAGVHHQSGYIFASTKNSCESGWDCIDEILWRL